MQEFKLPDLGEGMQEAEIRRWLVQPGDTITLDQPILEVETDKAVVEIPAPTAGRVSAIHVKEGAVAKLGQLLISFDTPVQSRSDVANTLPDLVDDQAKHALAAISPSAQTNGESIASRRVLASPAVRKRAFELDIDLKLVSSSHPTGRITMEDLQHYADRPKQESPIPMFASSSEPVSQRLAPVPSNGSGPQTVAMPQSNHIEKPPISVEPAPAEERQPLTGLRRRIAEHMELSWRTIPHATAFDTLDGTELVALRQQLKPLAEQRGVRLTYMPLLIKLLLPVLKEFPLFNASLDEERREIIYKRAYHIGIATDSPEGLLVPVLRNADQMTIIQIATQLDHLVTGAQKRSLSLHELMGSTFTLNNIGSFGGGSGTPIINHPEVAILAVGRLQEQPVIYNGAIVSRMMMPLALSFDHRLIDGALAGRFLARFKSLVEHPQQLLLDLV